jgi:hypothetical protein
MTKSSNISRKCWPDFLERYGENRLKDSTEPHDVLTTKWGVTQFGWPAACSKTGCEQTWCVCIREGGKGLITPRCDHSPDGKYDVYAADLVIRTCQSKRDWP